MTDIGPPTKENFARIIGRVMEAFGCSEYAVIAKDDLGGGTYHCHSNDIPLVILMLENYARLHKDSTFGALLDGIRRHKTKGAGNDPSLG